MAIPRKGAFGVEIHRSYFEENTELVDEIVNREREVVLPDRYAFLVDSDLLSDEEVLEFFRNGITL